MDTFASAWLSGKENPPSVSEFVRTVGDKMDFKTAAAKIDRKKLPEDVASLIKTTAEDAGESKQPFSEASLDKARVALNGLVEASWKELDDKIIECKEFEEQNRGTFEQVMSDISRLVEQISDLQPDSSSERGRDDYPSSRPRCFHIHFGFHQVRGCHFFVAGRQGSCKRCAHLLNPLRRKGPQFQ